MVRFVSKIKKKLHIYYNNLYFNIKPIIAKNISIINNIIVRKKVLIREEKIKQKKFNDNNIMIKYYNNK